MTKDEDAFKKYREEALKFWLNETSRNKDIRTRDHLAGSYECKWQAFTNDDEHLNFCCAFGEFCNIITDILTDKRLDKYILGDFSEYQESSLFRYYMNFYIIIEQILDDFEQIKLSYSLYDPGSLKCFINNFIKHKNKGAVCFYNHNDHIPKSFEDYEYEGKEGLSIDTQKVFLNKKDIGQFYYFKIPSLKYGLEIVIENYKRLDNFLMIKENEENFIKQYLNN